MIPEVRGNIDKMFKETLFMSIFVTLSISLLYCNGGRVSICTGSCRTKGQYCDELAFCCCDRDVPFPYSKLYCTQNEILGSPVCQISPERGGIWTKKKKDEQSKKLSQETANDFLHLVEEQLDEKW